MGWFLYREYDLESISNLPQEGDLVGYLHVTNIKETAKNEYHVYLGEQGEETVDAYNARREYYINQLKTGKNPDKKELFKYNLL